MDNATAIDLFSMEEVGDLPPEIQRAIGKSNSRSAKIANVCKRAGRPITINELVVGYYRLYGEEVLPAVMRSSIYSALKGKKPEIERVRKGLYRHKK